LSRSDGVRVASIDSFAPNVPSGWLLFGKLLLEDNVEAGKRYVSAFLRGVADYRAAYEPGRRGYVDVIAALEKHNMPMSSQTPSLGFPPDGKPSFVGVEDFARWQLAHGTIKEMPDLVGLTDLRFLRAASGARRA
jgi:hypothetical protein